MSLVLFCFVICYHGFLKESKQLLYLEEWQFYTLENIQVHYAYSSYFHSHITQRVQDQKNNANDVKRKKQLDPQVSSQTKKCIQINTNRTAIRFVLPVRYSL